MTTFRLWGAVRNSEETFMISGVDGVLGELLGFSVESVLVT